LGKSKLSGALAPNKVNIDLTKSNTPETLVTAECILAAGSFECFSKGLYHCEYSSLTISLKQTLDYNL
jgi:hypothetical protein